MTSYFPNPFFRYSFSYLIIGLILNGSLLAQSSPLKTISPVQAKKDIALLKEVVEAIHPALYLHLTKEEWNALYESTINSVTMPLDSKAFIDLANRMIHAIGCGHTSLGLEEELTNLNPTNLLPFYGSYINGKLYIGRSPIASSLKGNAEILAIDGESGDSIINRMMNSCLLNADGYGNRLMNYYLQNRYFYSFYNYFHPNKDTIQLIVKEAEKIDTLMLATIPRDSFINDESGNTIITDSDSIYQILQFDTLNWRRIYYEHKRINKKMKLLDAAKVYLHKERKDIGLLKLTGFQNNQIPYYKWLFPYLRQKEIEHLILDLRGNLGGSIKAVKNLLEYLVTRPYKITFHQKRYSRSIKKRLKKAPLYYAWTNLGFRLQVQSKRKNGEKYYQSSIRPKKKNAYNGKLYVLIDGGTFSGGAVTSAFLREDKRAVFFGTETGGNRNYTNGGRYKVLSFPASKTGLVIPKNFLNHHLKTMNKGRGVIPDYFIPLTIEDIVKEEDRVLSQVLDYIESHP